MIAGLLLQTGDAGGTAGGQTFLLRFGWPIGLLLGLLLFAYYFQIELRRRVRHWKILAAQSRWLDAPTLDYIRQSIAWMITFTLILVALILLSFTDDWFRQTVGAPLAGYVGFGGVIVITWALTGTLVRIWHRVMTYLSGTLPFRPAQPLTPNAATYIELLLRYLLLAIAVGVSFVALIGLIGRLLGSPVSDALTASVSAFFARKGVEIGFFIVSLAIAGAVLWGGEILARDIKAKRIAGSAKFVDIARTVFRYSVLTFMGIWSVYSLLQIFGFQQNAFIIVLLVLAFFALAVGVVLSSSLRNALSGLHLMGAHPFEEGDRIRLGDRLTGQVRSVGTLHTLLELPNGELLHIPNNDVVAARITNLSRGSRASIAVTVRAPLRVPAERIEELLVQAAGATEGIAHNREPEVFAVGIAKDAAVYELVTTAGSQHGLRRTESRLLRRIHKTFLASSIPIEAAATESDPSGVRDSHSSFWVTHARGPERQP